MSILCLSDIHFRRTAAPPEGGREGKSNCFLRSSKAIILCKQMYSDVIRHCTLNTGHISFVSVPHYSVFNVYSVQSLP